jgi:hypothetical protein
VSGNPITAAGTITLSLATQTANTVFAGPATGPAAAPTFRALVAADIPDLSGTYLKIDQSTPQAVYNGAPNFELGVLLGYNSYYLIDEEGIHYGDYLTGTGNHLLFMATDPELRDQNSVTVLKINSRQMYGLSGDPLINFNSNSSVTLPEGIFESSDWQFNMATALQVYDKTDAVNWMVFNTTTNSTAIGRGSQANYTDGFTAGTGCINNGTRCVVMGYNSTMPTTASQGCVNIGTSNTTSQDAGVFVNVGAGNSMTYTVSAVMMGYLQRARGYAGNTVLSPIMFGNSNDLSHDNAMVIGRSIKNPFANMGYIGHGSTGQFYGLAINSSTNVTGIHTRNPQADFDVNGNVLVAGGGLGSELVTNGAFASDTSWTKGTGWTISGGFANHTGGSGALTPTSAITPTVGKIYEISFDVVGTVGNNATLDISFGGVSCPQFLSGDTNFQNTTNYKFRVLASSTANLSITAVNTISIDNVSVKEITGGSLTVRGDLIHKGTNVGLYDATPVARATTAGAASTYAAVGGSNIQTNDTFDGYTVAQVVKALRNIGVLT